MRHESAGPLGEWTVVEHLDAQARTFRALALQFAIVAIVVTVAHVLRALQTVDDASSSAVSSSIPAKAPRSAG